MLRAAVVIAGTATGASSATGALIGGAVLLPATRAAALDQAYTGAVGADAAYVGAGAGDLALVGAVGSDSEV
jgi:hypothetical protein